MITRLSFALLLFISFPAFAEEFAFYTDGNFQIIVDAFRRIALFYGTSSTWLIGIFVAGVLIAALTQGASGLAQKVGGKDTGAAFITSLAFSVIGLIVFAAGVTPKADVIVYDKSNNRFETVADVPMIIAFPAAGLSSLVEAFAVTENTAKAYTYGELASGSPFHLVKSALSSSKMFSSHIIANIHSLYMDCASTAIASGNLDIDELRNNTFDLLTTLEGLKHNSIETTTYNDTYPNGTGVTCADGYEIVKSQLSQPATFDKQLSALCKTLQLDIDQAAERVSCLNTISNSFDTIYGSGGNVIDWQLALQNMLVAEVVGNALTSGAGDSAINIGLSRETMAESIGAWEASARYFPIIKGALFAVLLGVAPVLLIFIITPLIGKALRLYFGLWGFYGLWLLTDMVVLTSMSDTIYAATTHIASNKMGLLSVWTSHSDITDALSTIGSGRGIGLTVAVTISALMFGISPHSLAGIANKMEGDVEQKGKQLGTESMMTEVAGNRLDGMVSGNASLSALGGNMSSTTRGQSMSKVAETHSDNLTTTSLGGVSQAAAGVGATQAAQRTGAAQATRNEGFSAATDASRIEKEGEFSQAAAIQSVANTQSAPTRDYQQDKSDLAEGETGGRVAAMSEGAGIETNSRNAGVYSGTESRANADHILVAGAEDIYRTQAQSIEKSVAQSDAVDKLQPDSGKFFSDSSLRSVAEESGRNRGADLLGTDSIQKGSAGEYIDGLEQSVTRTNVAGGELDDRRSFARDDATIKAYDDKAEHDLRGGLRKDLQMSDAELSQSLLGRQDLNLSAEQAEKAKESGIISEEQYQLAKNNDGVVLSMNAKGNEADGLTVLSTEASSKESVELDKSQHYDTSFSQNDSISRNSSVDHDASAVNMNEHSSRIIFSDADKLYTFTGDLKSKLQDEQQVNNEIGVGASTGLKAVAGFTNTEGYEGTTSAYTMANVAAKVGTPMGGLVGSEVSASAEAGIEGRASDISRDERTEDLAAKHFGDLHEQLQYFNDKKVGTEFETQAEADQATAREFAGYYNHLTNGLLKQDLKEFDMFIANGSLDGAWSRYSEETGVGKEVNLGMPREAWDDPQGYAIGTDPNSPREEPKLNSPIASDMISSAMGPVSGVDQAAPPGNETSEEFGPLKANPDVQNPNANKGDQRSEITGVSNKETESVLSSKPGTADKDTGHLTARLSDAPGKAESVSELSLTGVTNKETESSLSSKPGTADKDTGKLTARLSDAPGKAESVSELSLAERTDSMPSPQIQQTAPMIRVKESDSKDANKPTDIPNESSNSSMPLVASKASNETMPTIERAGSSNNLPPLPSNIKL